MKLRIAYDMVATQNRLSNKSQIDPVAIQQNQTLDQNQLLSIPEQYLLNKQISAESTKIVGVSAR